MKLAILSEKEDPRIAITPIVLKDLIKIGIHEILVEKDVGSSLNLLFSNFDNIYSQERSKILSNADLFITISPLSLTEINTAKEDATLISRFNSFNDENVVKTLAQKKHTVFSLDMIPRSTIAQSSDVLSSLSSIAGYKAVLIATEHFNKFIPMLTTAAGTIPPAKILVIGAGVAGLQAIATAKRLGANVSAFDTRVVAKSDVQSLGVNFIEVEGATDDSSAGGYAVEQTEEYRRKQLEVIEQTVSKVDIVITTAQLRGKPAPKLITTEMVKKMSPGSVIVDLASSTGGNCELTQDKKTVNEYGVTIIGDSDLSRKVPYHASVLYSKNILHFLKFMVEEKDGSKKINPYNLNHEVTRSSCIVLTGEKYG